MVGCGVLLRKGGWGQKKENQTNDETNIRKYDPQKTEKGVFSIGSCPWGYSESRGKKGRTWITDHLRKGTKGSFRLVDSSHTGNWGWKKWVMGMSLKGEGKKKPIGSVFAGLRAVSPR